MMAVLMLLMAGLVSSSVICPDGNQCQDTNTCCPTETGYACCTYPDAVCCSDKAHCCPQGYKCNMQTMHCDKKGLPWYSFPMSPKRPAEESNEKPSFPAVVSSPSVSVVHCDNYVVCPDGTTCCRDYYGRWTCCPFSIGQCCRDGIHCCPYGYHCDITSTKCLRGALSLPASQQLPAMLISTKQCYCWAVNEPPLNEYLLPGDPDLCCLGESGCCPHGFHCDEESRACVGDSIQAAPLIPLMQAVESQDQNEVQAGVIRCNTHFFCPAGQSCCKATTGQWACCPYPLGQCCKDGKHCCEYGYECDSTSSTCQKGKTSFPARPKKNALFL